MPQQRPALSFVSGLLIAGAFAACPLWISPAAAQVGARQQAQRQIQPGGRRGEEKPETAGKPADEDQKKIDEASTGSALMELGKTFVLAQKLDAAARAVEKAVQKDPKLLEDGEKQTPKAWNDFWFNHRAKLREKKLTGKDAAGRVKLAIWLDAGGLTGPARAMLTAALAINKEEPSAKELAEKWSLYAGGPVRFDLTLGLKEPLFVTNINDEGQSIIPRTKERSYLIIPFACDTGGQRLMMGRGDFKVVDNDGKACAVAGFMVVERTDSGGGGDPNAPDAQLNARGQLPELKLQAASEPLWEQIQFQAGERDKPQELVLSNLMHPLARPAPGAKKNEPPPPASGQAGPNKTNKPSTGYLALVVEVSDSAKSVDCTYTKGGAQAQLDIEFMKAVGKSLEKLLPADQDKLVVTLAAQTTNKSPAVASAALYKLNEIRLGGKGQGSSGQVLKASEEKTKIETGMIAAFAHESPLVRRDAFNLLSRNESEELGARIAKAGEAAVATNLLAELQAYFADVQAVVSAAAAATNPDGTPAPPPQFNTSGGEAATGLPKLPLAPAVPALLAGCMNSKSAGEQALELCLANPCDQTVDLLKNASDELVGRLLKRVAQITDPKVKTAILRTLLRGKSGQLPKILTAFKGTQLTIDKEDDPILALAISEQPAAVQLPLLELLAKANFSAQATSEKMKKLIEKYTADDLKPDAKLQAAIVNLAEKQLKADYSAPVKRGNQPSMNNPGPGPQGPVGFDTLLASVATSPTADAAVARQAAAKLVSLGQVRALADRLARLQGEAKDKRVRDLITTLVADKKLQAREALPVFLAMQLASTDGATKQAALSGMTAILSGVDVKDRWRIKSAIKQGLEAKQLVSLSLDPEEKTSRAAMSLLRELAAMTSAESAEFAAATDEGGRQARLATLEQDRTTKNAVGEFACIVYLDVRANTAPPAAATPGATSPATPLADRDNVPLETVNVNFQRGAKDGKVTIFAATQQIAPPTKKPEGQGNAEPAPGSISMDAALLLRRALELPDAKKEGLAGKINPAVLRTVHLCELKYEQLGAWSAELTIQETPDSTSNQYPYRLVGAKILLEPVTH